jgi:hypothetical protein
MTARERCTFCDRPATERHHVGGQTHCRWFHVPLCIPHHRMVTTAYRNADSDMMKSTSNLEQRIKRAREGCHVFLWLLDHPEVIDPGTILGGKV